ncbi:MAG: protein phosphatase 2C domain-containing protein [Candidatus Yanofskybacteria bacterium]|nr:protein phosphatase 2C domain-containing protein [Candidatus Yanofskybacteria bacterium]
MATFVIVRYNAVMHPFRYTSDSLKGTKRKENKDRIWISEKNEWIFSVLFDGISSAKEANRGIDIAVDFLEKNYQRFLVNRNLRLADLMFEVNSQIIKAGLNSPFATYSAAYFNSMSGMAKFSNLGDSRIYEVTPQYLKQLTQDDNLVHDKNVVTKYLGMVELTREQILEFLVNTEGKRILLCSDGFYSILEEKLSRFYEIFNFKNEVNIKKSLSSEIEGNNFDDASYVLVFK